MRHPGVPEVGLSLRVAAPTDRWPAAERPGPVGFSWMTKPGADVSTPIAEALQAARDRTLGLVAHLSDDELERQVDPIMSPLVWDLGHIAAYEDLWLVHRFAGAPLLRPDLAARYDAFDTPRAVR